MVRMYRVGATVMSPRIDRVSRCWSISAKAEVLGWSSFPIPALMVAPTLAISFSPSSFGKFVTFASRSGSSCAVRPCFA
jgi:hypothetical protein